MSTHMDKPAIDPLKLAGITVEAVDMIGNKTATEIEATADAILEGANEIADQLKALAKAIREHSEVAAQHVSTFVERNNSVLETVRGLHAKLAPPAGAPAASRNGNGADHPEL